jgi:hypothetical protein
LPQEFHYCDCEEKTARHETYRDQAPSAFDPALRDLSSCRRWYDITLSSRLARRGKQLAQLVIIGSIA